MTDQAWSAGQVVAYYGAYDRVPQRQIIDRVTPSGIAVIGRSQYNKNGYARGDSGYSTPRIVPWEDGHAKQVRQHREERARQAIQSYQDKFPRIPEAELRSVFDAAITAVYATKASAA